MLTRAIAPICGIAIDSPATKRSHQIIDVKRNKFGSYNLNYSVFYPNSDLKDIIIPPHLDKLIVADEVTTEKIIQSHKNFSQFLKLLQPSGDKSFRPYTPSPAINFSIVFDDNNQIFAMHAMRAEAVMIEKISNVEAKRRQLKDNPDKRLTHFHDFSLYLLNQNLPPEQQKSDISFEQATNIVTHLVSSAMTKYAFRENIDMVYREKTHIRLRDLPEKMDAIPAKDVNHYLPHVHRSVKDTKETTPGRGRGVTPFTASRKPLNVVNLALINHFITHGENGLSPEIIHSIATYKNQASLYKLVA
jgi:hypothetical protein